MQDELDAIEQKILRKILPWLVAGGLAVGGVGGTGVLRVDKFTGTDAELMKADILSHISDEQRLEDKECQLFRQAIYKRLDRMELYQDQIVALIRANGMSLKP